VRYITTSPFSYKQRVSERDKQMKEGPEEKENEMTKTESEQK
jgi:hypothetical protein